MSLRAFPKLPGLDFREDGHVYCVNGVKRPSVTGILKEVGLIEDLFYTEDGRERGRAVHAACHYLDDDDLAAEILDGRILPYLRAYESFKKDSGFVPVFAEGPVFHKSIGYVGTPDRIGKCGGRWTLLDIKTGRPEPWAALQTAAYVESVCSWADTFGIESHVQRLAVELRSDETYRAHWYRDPRDAAVFFSCAAVVNWKHLKYGGPKNEK